MFWRTWKGTLLTSGPLGVTTWSVPVVAPAGTALLIKKLEFMVKTAGAPLKVTLVARLDSASLNCSLLLYGRRRAPGESEGGGHA
jgi:hypothetical protein